MTRIHVPAAADARLLRPLWASLFGDAFRLAAVLALLAATVRGVGMLGMNYTIFYWL